MKRNQYLHTRYANRQRCKPHACDKFKVRRTPPKIIALIDRIIGKRPDWSRAVGDVVRSNGRQVNRRMSDREANRIRGLRWRLWTWYVAGRGMGGFVEARKISWGNPR